MDVYEDFFAKHDLTHFCQITILKPIMKCPQTQLSIVMQWAYKLGSFNASLFATEGIASVGTLFAPVAVFICGFVIALGNRLSAGLPAGFVLISGANLPQLLLNVPLTTALLTHGMGLLFLLWYVTPRVIFEQNPGPYGISRGSTLLRDPRDNGYHNFIRKNQVRGLESDPALGFSSGRVRITGASRKHK